MLEIASYIVLVLLTVVGYSSGAVIVTSRRQPVPRSIDLIIVMVLIVAAVFSKPFLGRWSAIGVWVAISFCTAFIGLYSIRQSFLEIEHSPVEKNSSSFFRRLWNNWKSFSFRMGNYQGRLLLGLFFFTAALPFGLLLRIFSNRPAIIKNTDWLDRQPSSKSIDSARDQF